MSSKWNKELKDLNIEEDQRTPKVIFCASDGLMHISGKSIPENSVAFYKPLLQWIENYLENPAPKTTVRFEMVYFNTSSSLGLLEVLKKIKRLQNDSPEDNLEVFWYYDSNDLDMKVTGEDFSELLNLPINILEL